MGPFDDLTAAQRMQIREAQAARKTASLPKTVICECYMDCRVCSLTGDWHVHAGEPCPIHPDAPGDQ